MYTKHFFATLILLLSFIAVQSSESYEGFRVEGRFLYDACGEKVILRGVSNPNIWFQQNGNPHMAEIERTGANVVRIVWDTHGKVSVLDEAINNCRAHNMIPMVELHDATGEIDKVQQCVDYWVRTDVANVLISHQNYLLVNIANEPGNGSVSAATFRSVYQQAITRMRDAGIKVPLVIDGTDWGKNINILQSEGPGLIEHDPLNNLIFSVHMWWPAMYGFSTADIERELLQSADMDLPLIVGEFSQMHGSCDDSEITTQNAIDYQKILEKCTETQTGYIAWSWFGNCNSLWDMTSDGTYENLYSWGLDVALDNQYSIKNTSVRPYSIVNGVCNPELVSVHENKHTLHVSHFPNPAQDVLILQYSLTEKSDVICKITDINGVVLKKINTKSVEVGSHEIRIDLKAYPQGIYFYSFTVNEKIIVNKFLVVK